MNSTTPPALSIILVSWNRREDLTVAIESIRQQDHPSYEIIIVDNGSTDGTVEHLQSGQLGSLTLYRSPANLGASVARNIGLRLARGRWIAFMDSDAELLDNHLCSALQARLEADPGLAAIAPAIYLDRQRQEVWLLGGYHLRGGYCDVARSRTDSADPHYLSTCVSLWRCEMVTRLGGFDPALPYGFEDNDLSLRARRAGGRLAVEPALAACHHLSKASRIRAEADGWSHFDYDERARALVQLKDLGLWDFLRQEAWLCSGAGRLQRHYIHLHSGLRRRRKLQLYTLSVLGALASHPRYLLTRQGGDFIDAAPLESGRVERIAATRDCS